MHCHQLHVWEESFTKSVDQSGGWLAVVDSLAGAMWQKICIHIHHLHHMKVIESHITSYHKYIGLSPMARHGPWWPPWCAGQTPACGEVMEKIDLYLVNQLILCKYPMNIMNIALTITSGARFCPSRVSYRWIFSERLIWRQISKKMNISKDAVTNTDDKSLF